MNGLESSTKILKKELFTPKLFCGAKLIIFCFINYHFKTTNNSVLRNFVKSNIIDSEIPLYIKVMLILNYKIRLHDKGDLVPVFNSCCITV